MSELKKEYEVAMKEYEEIQKEYAKKLKQAISAKELLVSILKAEGRDKNREELAEVNAELDYFRKELAEIPQIYK